MKKVFKYYLAKIRITGPFYLYRLMRLVDHRDSNLRRKLRRRDLGDRVLVFGF